MLKKMVVLSFFICMVMSMSCIKNYPLWKVYTNYLVEAKYVDLTHAFSPDSPVWPGFGKATFMPAKADKELPNYVKKDEVFNYEKHGFVATGYNLPADQYGTQLDPPAHWDPYYPTIDELPPTYAIRPLVVIDIHEKVEINPGYHCSVEDIKEWEERHGTIPKGAVVMVRSDWSKKWPGKDFLQKPFPGVSLDALKYLHQKRHILFHGHEPLDTDTTPNLEGEYWLMHNGYCQAEGVTNLWMVPEAGALIAIGFAKPMGGTGGYARYVAICPPEWEYGVSISEFFGAPLPKYDRPLNWDEVRGLRIR